MPYIKKDKRIELDLNLQNVSFVLGSADIGALNYCITKLCLNFLSRTEKRYVDYNAIIGAVESAKLELYRRAVSTYEDTKIQENGDVY